MTLLSQEKPWAWLWIQPTTIKGMWLVIAKYQFWRCMRYLQQTKKIFDHLVSQSYSSHLNFQNNRESQEKKNISFVIIADWLLNGQAPFNPHQLVAIPKLPASHPIPGPHLLQRRVFFRWPTWESSKVVQRAVVSCWTCCFFFESFAKHQCCLLGK